METSRLISRRRILERKAKIRLRAVRAQTLELRRLGALLVPVWLKTKNTPKIIYTPTAV